MADKNTTMGPISIVVGADPKERNVIVAFNMALNRIELSPEGARDIARNLMSRADIADGTVSPLTVVENGHGKPEVEGAPV